MLAIVIAHFVVGAMAPVIVRALGRRAFWVLALVTLATLVWAVYQQLTLAGRLGLPFAPLRKGVLVFAGLSASST